MPFFDWHTMEYNRIMSDQKPSRFVHDNNRLFGYFRVLNPKRSAFRIAFYYLIFGVLWILLTDKILELFFGTSATYNLLQTFKGWIYVILTAFFLYHLSKTTLELYHQANARVQQSKNELEEQYDKTLESEQRFDLAVKGSFDSIWEYDGKTERYFMSNAILKGLGYELDHALTDLRDYIAYIDEADKERFIKAVNAFSDVPTDLFELTYRLKRKDGTSAWIRTRGSAQISPTGKILKVAGSHTDVSLLIDHQEALAKIAYYDQLTGLPNWKRLGQIVTAKIQEDPDQSLTILFLDLDDFQNINDFHGYPFGDKVLMALAKSLSEIMEDHDILASLGGDSYGILIPSIDKSVILNKIAEIFAVLRGIHALEGQAIVISACIGIAQYPQHARQYDQLMHCADEAMHDAKHKGKNTFVFFTDELHQQQLSKIELSNKLRKAVERNELSMVYQPIYDLKSGALASAEALVRWTTDGKAIPPDVFIPLAETTGLIGNIEYWVFEAVFKQVVALRSSRTRNIPIAINLSSKGISDEGFIEAIISLMDKMNILPGEVKIEITETSLIDQPEKALVHLHRLHQRGVKILLDDFGKDYSSLTYLVSLPIDLIKIDKSFIQKIHSSKDIDAVIKGIVELVHAINLKVIAEGIEVDNQKLFMSELGVDYGQGYLLDRPMTADDLITRIKKPDQ